MNYELWIDFGRSGFAVGLSAISLLAYPASSRWARRNDGHLDKLSARFRYRLQNLVLLAKDAASIPNAGRLLS